MTGTIIPRVRHACTDAHQRWIQAPTPGQICDRCGRDASKGPVRYHAVWRVDGRQKWRSFARRKAAERFLASAVKATHDGTYQDVTPELMSTVFDNWQTRSLDVRVKQGLLKPSTAKSYRSMLAQHLRSAFGNVRSDRLRPALIEDWARARANEIAAGTIAPKFYNNLVNLLSAILKWARHPAQSYLAHDPLAGLKRLPRSKMERAFLEPAGITTLLTVAADVRDSTIIATAVYTGLRRGELFAVRWADVDWTHSQIAVRRSLYQGAITTPKTEHSIRAVDVPDSMLACLAIYRAYYPPLDDGYIFRTDGGAPLDPDNWYKRSFIPIAVGAGLRPVDAQDSGDNEQLVGLHTLRHTYASLLINQGESIKYVSKQLGHASIQITADLYGHLFRETSTAAMRKLDLRIGAAQTARGRVVQLRTGTES